MRILSFIVALLCVVFSGLNARATLVPYSTQGVNVVYSSFSDITWLQNGNLLNTWFLERGVNTVFNEITAVVPSVTLTYSFAGPQTHTLTLNDFTSFSGDYDGSATFYGAYAFTQYLNIISYAGINNWRLPDAVNDVYPNPFPCGYTKAGDFGQLYYDELNSPSGFGLSDPLNYFVNKAYGWHWSFTMLQDYGITQPFGFLTSRGDQYFLNPDFKYFVWPVFSGRVPEPTSGILIMTGLLIFTTRRRV